MEQLLANIDLSALGVAGPALVYLAYLYREEVKERRSWQDRAFKMTRESHSELVDALKTIDAALNVIQRS